MIRRSGIVAALVVPVAVLAGCGELPLPDQSPTRAGTTSTSAASSAAVTSPLAATSAAATPAPALRVVDYTSPPTVTGVWHPTCEAQGFLPDRHCTPGSVAPRTKAQVCVPGFSASVRPSSRNSERAKTTALRSYGIAGARRTTTELDHLVPLSLGGSNDTSNLWPEASDIPNAGFRNTKDRVEDRVHDAVCRAGSTIPLDAAQAAFANDWTTALEVLGIR